MSGYFLLAIPGLIPAVIASQKGRPFLLWWAYGTFAFVLAFPHALIMKRIIHTRFRTPGPIVAWPKEFVVLTGFTTLEQVWPRAEAELRTLHENRLADQALGNEIETMGCWYTRLTGYLPKGTPEPGWVAALAPEEGAALALRHDQESIYVVRGDELSLRNCEVGSEIKMGSWRERVTA